MTERLKCADCGATAEDSADRCPACGSRRLLGPQDLLARPWLLALVVLFSGAILLGLTLFTVTVPLSAFFGTRVFPWELERRTRSLDVQLDQLRDAERSLPDYPGATRIKEVHGTIAGGVARTISVCWAAGDDYETVRRFYTSRLLDKSSGWQSLGGSTRIFRKGRVYLAITPPESVRSGCAGAYQMNFSYQV
jgi:hypothetical protein